MNILKSHFGTRTRLASTVNIYFQSTRRLNMRLPRFTNTLNLKILIKGCNAGSPLDFHLYIHSVQGTGNIVYIHVLLAVVIE